MALCTLGAASLSLFPHTGHARAHNSMLILSITAPHKTKGSPPLMSGWRNHVRSPSANRIHTSLQWPTCKDNGLDWIGFTNGYRVSTALTGPFFFLMEEMLFSMGWFLLFFKLSLFTNQVTTNAPFCDVYFKGYNTIHGNFTTGQSCKSQLEGC